MMNRRKAWKKAQQTKEGVKIFLTKLAGSEKKWMETGYSDGNYTRNLIGEALSKVNDAETRAMLLECSRMCPDADPFVNLSFDIDEEKKIYPIYWEPGEVVEFGRYPQGENGEELQIEWMVLGKNYAGMGSDTYLLLSRYGLDAKRYNERGKACFWETCTLRAWLNREFVERAFNEEERKKIVLTHIENPDNRKYNTRGGKATDDMVFLLSLDEVQNRSWFEHRADRICYVTPTAWNNGAWVESGDTFWWWLRSPGDQPSLAARVGCDGKADYRGSVVAHDYNCVRPAVVVRLP